MLLRFNTELRIIYDSNSAGRLEVKFCLFNRRVFVPIPKAKIHFDISGLLHVESHKLASRIHFQQNLPKYILVGLARPANKNSISCLTGGHGLAADVSRIAKCQTAA